MLTRKAVLTISLGLATAGLLACSDSNATPSDGGEPPSGDGSSGGESDLPSDSGSAGGELSELRLTDGSGNTWRLDGLADRAPQQLNSLPGHNAFWFAWSAFHPGTDVWGRDEAIRDAEIPSGDQCLIPCDEIQPGCSGGLDCIPPLDDPQMVDPGGDGLGYLRPSSTVLGVLTSEGPRAYPHNILWWHEIANESVGDQDYAVTLCPLTGSGLLFDRNGFIEGKTVRVGVSGNLYNSNLVMWDSTNLSDPRQDEDFSFWPQMRMQAVTGPQQGKRTPLLPVYEMTWQAWKSLHPDTKVLSSNTGESRDYTRYPYGDYRADDSDTFRATNPEPDPMFGNKDMVFGLVLDGQVRGYVWKVLEEQTGARRGVLNDELGGAPVAIVFDLDARYVHAFDRRVGDRTVELSLEGSGEQGDSSR